MTTATPSRNGAFPKDVRDAAELYVQRGLAPIPLPPRSKDPGYPDWQHLRLTADDLDGRFPRHEPRNVGVLNGSPSGNRLDVDLDVPETRAVAPHLLPPTGWRFGRPSSPLSHYIYAADRPFPKAQQEYLDLDGTMLCELRGDGGLTVYPPSLHKDTGEQIAWESFTEPGNVTLDDLQKAVGEVAAAALLARHWPRQGNRDKAAMALSGALARHWDAERVSRFVGAVALAAGDEEVRMREGKAAPAKRKVEDGEKVTGWPRLVQLLGVAGGAVATRVRQWLGLTSGNDGAGSKPKIRVRTLPPFQPFPVEALPMPLGAYVTECAQALRCDPAYVALCVLAAVGSTISNTRSLRLKRSWEEPCIIWAAIVGDSGTLKTPAFQKAVGFLFRHQKQLLESFKSEKEAYEDALVEYKSRKAKAKKAGEDFNEEPPAEPKLRRVVVSDTTIEKLGVVLEENPRGVLMARDELSGWLGSFTRYKGKGGGSDLPNWLEFFRAGTAVIDRKNPERPLLFIDRAAVSVVGGIQPGVLARALGADAFDSGLPARLLAAMPPKVEKSWSEADVSPETEQAYQTVIARLLELDFDADTGPKQPHVLRMNPQAKENWVAFYNAWAKEQMAVEGELAAAYSKLEAYAARFALLHHVVTCVHLEVDDRREVSPRSVEAGVTLCRWFANEARRIYMTLAETEEQRDTRRLVEFIQARGGRITVRELQRANSKKYPTREDAEAALSVLVDGGVARWIDPPSGKKASNIKVVELYPTPDTSDTSGGDDEDDGGENPSAPPTAPPGSASDTSRGAKQDSSQPAAGQQPAETDQGSVGSVGRRTEEQANEPASHQDQDSVSAPTPPETPGVGHPYMLVTDADGLSAVLTALADNELVGLDCETTGLDPRSDRLRLLSVNVEAVEGSLTYLVDCAAVDPQPLFAALSQTILVTHNGYFDLAFLRQLGFEPGAVYDTMLLSRLLYGTRHPRGFHSLEACVRRELGKAIDKDEQKSDWSRAVLTPEQLAYAATDAAVLGPLCRALRVKIKGAKLEQAAAIESRCLPPVVWMACSGVAFDAVRWQVMAQQAKAEAERLAAAMDALAPGKPEVLDFGSTWNWSSPQQAQEVFASLGVTVTSTDDDALAGIDHPLAALLRDYRAASKKAGTYGDDWLKHVSGDGRVYAGWQQLGADSGRMACKAPNLQNLPRGPEYRGCFAAPPGRVLVKADYSQVELRIAAKVSGDKAMLEAYQRGIDLHTLTAQKVMGITEVTKQHRQLAKAVNFGLLYGMGAKTFQLYALSNYGLTLTPEQAEQYRSAFFAAYPGLVRWHRQAGRTGKNAIETRTLAGRRRCGVARFTEKLNTPVQGTGADGLKLALALLWERRAEVPGAFPVLAVHDEIVVECDQDQAPTVADWLKRAMVDAMAPLIDPVPVEVEVKTAPTWGG